MIDPDQTIEQPQRLHPADQETLPPGETAAELVRVLDAYMAAIQAGEAPDRAQLLAEHPGLASQLEPCLAGIDFIHRAASPESSDVNPAMLGEFRIIREVGRGGMGVVYEAEQTSLRRKVALKVLRFGIVADEEAIRRFRVEAETVARLHHTNIVPIFAVGTEHDVSYYAMQFIDGRSLAGVQEEAQRDGRLIAPDDVARWGLQAAEALAHAHHRQVIHRDIKPSNLLIDGEGVVWLTDFGLAKRSDEVTLTLSGTLMGTPRYMSPEQAEAMKRPIDHRTDVYSLGASLYELATGRPVFESGTALGVIQQVLTTEPVPPRTVRPQIPRDLETILLTCLAKDPDRRYASAQALAEDLRSFLEGRAIKARRTPLWEKALRFARRQKKSAAIGTVAAVLALLAAGAGFALWRSNEEAKLGRLSFSTNGEPLTAEVLQADRDVRVGDPFTVPTRSPVLLPEGDYRVRLSTPGKLSETYQLRLERWLAQDFQVEMARRDLWTSTQTETTQATWRAYPFPVNAGNDLIEIDQQSISRVNWARQPVWSFKVANQAQLPTGADPKEWEKLLDSLMNLSYVELTPGVLRLMPDLNGDAIGDVVVSSRQQPIVFALSGKDGQILWHHKVETNGFPDAKAQPRLAGDPLFFEGVDGPILVATVEFSRPGFTGIQARRIEAIGGRDGRRLWQRETIRDEVRSVPAHRLRVDGKSLVGFVSGPEWVALDPLSGRPIGPSLNFAKLGPAPASQWAVHWLREPCIADLDGDGSDDLLVLVDTGYLNQLELMAVSARDQRRIWSETIDANFPTGDDSREPEATWPRLADLDGDGRPEVLVPYQVAVGPTSSKRQSVGLRTLDGKDGRERWSHRFRTENNDELTGQFLVGPDINGDGVRDVFSAETRADGLNMRGTLNQSTLYVDALSGRDGRSLWWWSRSVVSELLRFRPLRWWESGSDGLPKLVVDTGNDMFKLHDFAELFVLEASTGRLLHEAANFQPKGSADLNGDGLPELWGTSTDRANSALVRRTVAFGRPAEVWKRLGRWVPGRDYNRDGIADLLGPEFGPHNESNAISGLDGQVLWKAKLDRTGQLASGIRDAPSFSYHPLPDKLGDLDGDGVADVAVTREQSSGAVVDRSLMVGLGVCSGRTGKVLWENPKIPWDNRYLSWCIPCSVQAIDVDGRGRADLLVLLDIQGSANTGNGFASFDEFHLARFSGETGQMIAIGLIQIRQEGSLQNEGLPVRDFPKALADLDGDGRPEILFLLPRRLKSGGLTSDFVAVSATDGKVVWKHQGVLAMDNTNPFDDVWKRFNAADINGDGKAEIVLVDVIGGRPRVESWNSTSDSAPRWIWQGTDQDGGAVREVSAIPRLIKVEGSSKGEVVVIANQEKAGRRVVVLDAEGRVVRSRPIESNLLGHRIWTGDVDGDGKDELLFENRGKLCASKPDLTTILWESSTIGPVQEVRHLAKGGIEVDVGNGIRLDGPTGRLVSTPDWLSNPRLVEGPDAARPLALEVGTSVTTLYRTLPADAKAAPVVHSVEGRPLEDDPRVVRPLPWVVGSPGGLQERDRPRLPYVAFFTLASGFYSLAVLVGPILLLVRMIRGRGKVRELFLLPLSVASAFVAYWLIRSSFGPNGNGSSFVLTQSLILAVLIAFGGLPILTIAVETFRAFRKRGLRSLAGSLLLWASGCGLAAALLVFYHQREWMTANERYGWDEWWTIWLPGLYVAGCLILVWKVFGWPLRWVVRRARSRRQPA